MPLTKLNKKKRAEGTNNIRNENIKKKKGND